MNAKLEAKLQELPTSPGVYFHKDAKNEIIYVGKAANLRNRVRHYFQKSRTRDPKTDALVNEITDTDWVTLETELDALFVEAEMVRRYMPRYNILLRDDKSFIYVRIDIKSKHPTVSYTRRPLDDRAEYFGPYISKVGIATALKHLRKVFPYSMHAPTNIPKRACLQAQIGLCPGLESGMTTLDDYCRNLRHLMMYLRGSRKKLIVDIEKSMNQAAKAHKFEEAASYRNQLRGLKALEKQIIFGDRELHDISKDNGLMRLAEIINLDMPPRRIEGFDISHMSGTDNAASMVVFSGGVPDKNQYRKFKMRLAGNNDFGHMNEAISRRLSEKNVKQWGLPDLFLIDGGKGQVGAAYEAMHKCGHNISMIGLAKRYEEIILPEFADNDRSKIANFNVIVLRHNDDALKLLMRVRDESHRFAVSYHSVLKRARQKVNVLEEMPGIGSGSRKLLQRHFGSTKGVFEASEADIANIIGSSKAKIIVDNRPEVVQ
ncbi:MAG: UvrB/UvrC motif-containing protein [Candidatus Saccharimonadales bacterium]